MPKIRSFIVTTTLAVSVLSSCASSRLAATRSFAGSTAAQQGNQTVLAFKDPGRPGIVRVTTLMGTVTVRAADRRDVLIETRASDDRGLTSVRTNDRADGLRRLTPTGGYRAVEENNEMVITSYANTYVDLVITVPTKTNLKLKGTNGGPITVDGVDGDLEVDNTNAAITLTNVSGSVVAHSTNGDVKAALTRVTPQKPMAFTSFNGSIDVTLPPSLKATFKLRSDMNDIYTDFDLQVRPQPASQNSRDANGRLRIVANKSMTGEVNGGGPEIELRTFNGSVYLRKGAQR